MGGWNGIDALDNVSRYDPVSNVWTELPSLSIPRKNASALLITEPSPASSSESQSCIRGYSHSFPQTDLCHRLVHAQMKSTSSDSSTITNAASAPFFTHILRALSATTSTANNISLRPASQCSFELSEATPESKLSTPPTQRILVVGGWDESSTLRVNESLSLDDVVHSGWKRECTLICVFSLSSLVYRSMTACTSTDIDVHRDHKVTVNNDQKQSKFPPSHGKKIITNTIGSRSRPG